MASLPLIAQAYLCDTQFPLHSAPRPPAPCSAPTQAFSGMSAHRSPNVLPRLRNDLYCVEWDVKLYYTIPYPMFCQLRSVFRSAHMLWLPLLSARPRHRASLPFDQYQVILLDDRGTCGKTSNCAPPHPPAEYSSEAFFPHPLWRDSLISSLVNLNDLC